MGIVKTTGRSTTFISTETFTQGEFKCWVERRPLTDINRYELIDGRIVMTPPAGWGHGEVEARIVRLLGNFTEEHDLGRIFGSSTGYDLPSGETLEPDVSFISHDRWAKGPQVRRGQFLRIVPTLVVEILSPSTARRDRLEKKRLYEANEVEEYWLADPDRREVVVFRLVRMKYTSGTRYSASRTLRSRALPGFAVAVRLLFP